MSTEQTSRPVRPSRDRSVFFGVPRRIIGLLWLPIVVALIFLGHDQQVTPTWLYAVGLAPGVVGWLLFSLSPALSPRAAAATAVLLATGGLVLLSGSDGWTTAAAFPLLAAFVSGIRLPARAAAVFAALVATATVLVVGPYSSVWDPILVAGSVVVMLMFGIARQDAMRRADEHERALVADARAAAEHARAEAIADRARVARDVHDVLAHSLSALAVQLQGARLMAQRDGAAPDTIAQIERAQRLTGDGLAEARRAVRALREGPVPVDVVAELRDLVADHPDATLDVDERLRLGAREGETVLRTAQEALSNARKHAPGAPVTVHLHGDDGGASLEVVDVAGTAPPADDGHGSGLVGMAERAALVGAALDVGPTADGWRVALRVPGGKATDGGDRVSDLRVVLADDQRIVRDGLATVLGLLPGIEVVGTASGGDEAVVLVGELAPDVLLTDLRMPAGDGVSATARVRADHPGTAVVVLTTYVDDESVVDALRAGAAGWLSKDADAEAIARALHSAAAGVSTVDAGVLARLVEQRSSGAPGGPPPDGLTQREVEVLALIAEGLSNGEIARRLVVGEATVKTHVNHLFAKAGLRDRAQAVGYAYRHGLTGRT